MCRVCVIPGLDVRAQSLQKCKYASDVAYSILPEEQLSFPLKGSARRGASRNALPYQRPINKTSLEYLIARISSYQGLTLALSWNVQYAPE